VLFITADDDRLVPPQESEAMYARAGEPKKLVVLKGVGHYEVYGGQAFRRVMDETLATARTCRHGETGWRFEESHPASAIRRPERV
jgi:fermentation-respiration switch protein FrsA (DUF1100 family)